MSADRKPSLLSWSAQFRADVTSVDNTFAEAGRKLVDLLPKKFENFPTVFTVRRNQNVMDKSAAGAFQSAEIELTANAEEVTSAPEEMKRLFLDLGIRPGDEIAIEAMMAKRNPRADTRRFAEQIYAVTLMPTIFRPDLVGAEFDYAKRWHFLKPGTPVHNPEPVNIWTETERIREMGQVYWILEEGMVYDRYEEGTHASITRYKQKPHPYLATIHRATADWFVDLVNKRMA